MRNSRANKMFDAKTSRSNVALSVRQKTAAQPSKFLGRQNCCSPCWRTKTILCHLPTAWRYNVAVSLVQATNKHPRCWLLLGLRGREAPDILLYVVNCRASVIFFGVSRLDYNMELMRTFS